jgi:hypothetical protein
MHYALVAGRAVAAESAAAGARQLSETILTKNHSLEDARKNLTELGDQIAFGHTIPERNNNFDNLSR